MLEKHWELTQEVYQPEVFEEELLEEMEKTIGSEEPPESSFELVAGAEGTSPATPRTPEDDDYDGIDARNEKGEKLLSVVKVGTKKTFIQPPTTIEEPVKEINFENNVPETEKEGQKVGSASGVRLEGTSTLQTAEGINSAEEETQGEDLDYTFGKQETIGELYKKVLDAVASYRHQKAEQARYQAYRVRMAGSTEEAAEAAYQSLSPTLEAEENLDDLINRAEKTASDRARILKRIRVEASEVQETLEEVRWKFCELSQGEKSISEAGQTQSYVIKTNKSRSRTESRGSYQEKECPEASQEKRESRKEEKEVYQEEALGRHFEERGNRREKTAEKRALGVNKLFNEDLSENGNRATRGVELDRELYTLGKTTQRGNIDSLEKDQRRSAVAQRAVNLGHDVGGASYEKEGFGQSGEYKQQTKVVQKEGSQRKIPETGPLTPTVIINRETSAVGRTGK